MPKLDTHDPHLADILRRASLEREQQDQRLADIFGTQTVPKVTEETLAISLDYLKQHLEVPCQLTGIESLGCFAWEASYIFGRRRPKEYAQRKQQLPSYTDIYAWLNFEDAYDLRRLKPSIRDRFFLPGIWPRRSPRPRSIPSNTTARFPAPHSVA